jgi:hypothetical protein
MTTQSGGVWFIVAAITFWVAWIFMPDAGTNDAEHILKAVRDSRDSVWWSSVIHLLSSIAFVAGIVGAQTDPRAANSWIARWGAFLVLVGSLGVCADAFFHLMAYYMTAEGVDLGAVLEPMRLLQTQGIVFLVPLLLSVAIGGWIYVVGLGRAGVLSSRPWWMFEFAFVVAMVGGALVVGYGLNRQTVVLCVLGLVSLGYGWMGYELANRKRAQ